MILSMIKVPLGCLCLVAYMFAFYNRSKKLTTEGSKIFNALLITVIVNFITSFFSTIYMSQYVDVMAGTLSVYYNTYLLTTVLIGYFLYRYYLSHIELAKQKSYQKEKVVSLIVLLVGIIKMIITDVYYALGYEWHAFGPKMDVLYVLCVCEAIALGVHYYNNKEILPSNEVHNMRNTCAIFAIMVFVQRLIPDVSIVEFGYMAILLGIYLYMENPEKYVMQETGLLNEKALRRALNEHDVTGVPTPIIAYAFRADSDNQELLKKVIMESVKYMSRFRHMTGYHVADGVIVFINRDSRNHKNNLENSVIPKLSKNYNDIMEFSTYFRYPDDCKDFDEVMERLDEFILQNADAELFVDKMTGIYNRNRYEKDVQSFLEEKDKMTYFVADINNLKITNDKFGHLAGDGLIRDMARILQDVFSKEGHVYRTGGDEFAVIYMGKEHPDTMLEAVKKACKEKNAHRSIPVRYAIGYAPYEKGGKSWKETVEKADSEMYKDKMSNTERIKY